jgi:2-dehydro-3-deoxygluconokinase
MKKVCCFGELLMRLSPENGEGWINNTMPFNIGGAELNVATALAKWNLPVSYVTALPVNYLSNQLIKYIQSKNIDSTNIVFTGDRIGIYYLPIGYDVKNVVAFYDRDNTSFSTLMPGVINWQKVFKNTGWFHFSAISPALNENNAAACLEAVEMAASMGLKISIDLNYRSKLWRYGKKPVDIVPALVGYCDVIMGNIWAVENLLGIKSPIETSVGKTKDELLIAARKSMQEINNRFPKAKSLAYTFRLENTYWAMLQHNNNTSVSREYDIKKVVDKVGSGDCFMAGLIYGLNKNLEAKKIIDYAVAAAYGKLFEAGDSTKQTIEEVIQKIINDEK